MEDEQRGRYLHTTDLKHLYNIIKYQGDKHKHISARNYRERIIRIPNAYYI